MTGPRIARITTTRLDIPLSHPITMSFGPVRTQNIVLVRLFDSDGRQGIGEASILGGPHWGEESAESVQAVIDHYVAPALIGREIDGLEQFAKLMQRLIRGNAAARCALETAALDLLSRSLGVSASQLLGGRSRTRIPVAWTLSTGSADSDIEEGERAIEQHGHRRFKLKFGGEAPCADVSRAAAIIRAFEGRASIIADVNQAWDEVTAARWLPALQDAGLDAIEQPLPAADIAGIARLRVGLGMDVIADEAISNPQSAFLVAAGGAASAFALKPGRDGGPTASRRVAAIAIAAGLGIYGGSMLETSVGSAASALLFGALPDLRLGCELFGPMRLSGDIVSEPLLTSDGCITVPTGVGLGVELDEARIAFFAGARAVFSIPQSPNGGASGGDHVAHDHRAPLIAPSEPVSRPVLGNSSTSLSPLQEK